MKYFLSIIFGFSSLLNAQEFVFDYEMIYLSPSYDSENDKIISDTLIIQTNSLNPYFFKIKNSFSEDFYDLNLMNEYGVKQDTLFDHGKLHEIPFITDFEKFNFYQTQENIYDVYVSQGGHLGMFHKFTLEVNPDDVDIMSILLKDSNINYPKGGILKFNAFETHEFTQISAKKIHPCKIKFIISKPHPVSFLDELIMPKFDNPKCESWLHKFANHADKAVFLDSKDSNINMKEYMLEMQELQVEFEGLKKEISKSDLEKLKKAYDSIPFKVSTIKFD